MLQYYRFTRHNPWERELVWHQTDERHIDQILGSGVLLPTSGGDLRPRRDDARVLWLTKEPVQVHPERSAYLGRPRYEFRALVPSFWLVSWADWALRNGCGADWVRTKVATGDECSWVCEQPIERGYWLSVRDMETNKPVSF